MLSDPREARFHTTLWDVVRTAGGGASEERDQALEALCRAYWYPLYAFLRRRGQGPEDAADLVQGFFAHFLGRQDLEGLDPARGRFRSWLLASLSNFVANERAREQTLKRGGGRARVSFDAGGAEERFQLEPVDERTPERLFDRAWALTVLERALERLRQEQRGEARRELFDRLRGHLSGQPEDGGLLGVAEAVGSTTGAVKVALHRLRVRYRELLRREVAETLGTEGDVDSELAVLLEALAAPG